MTPSCFPDDCTVNHTIPKLRPEPVLSVTLKTICTSQNENQKKTLAFAHSLHLSLHAEHHDFIVDLGTWFGFLDCVTATASTSAPASSHNLVDAAWRSVLQFLLIKAPAPTQPCSPPPDVMHIYRSPAMHAHMAKVGISLLVSTTANGCPHTAASIMQGLLSLGHSYRWVLAQCEAEGGSGMTLLQHAETSGSDATLQLILNLGQQHGMLWRSSSTESRNSDGASSREDAYESTLGARRLVVPLQQNNSITPAQLSGRSFTQAITLDGSVNVPQHVARGFSSTSGEAQLSSGKESLMAQHGSNKSSHASAIDQANTNVGLPFSESAYQLWLVRKNAIYTDQFYTIMLFGILFGTIRKVLEGRPAQEYTSVVLLVFLLSRIVGSLAYPAWFERHSESQHVLWRAIKITLQVLTVAFNWQYCAGPPLPYLAKFDWLIEGVLAVLCTQVRALH